ncbi:Caulimovirus viroplasmin domain containing protein [Amanita muscaria]
MSANTKQKYYAVRVGRDGPMIYNTWDECKEKVSGFPNAEFKSFKSRELAEEWLGSMPQSQSVVWAVLLMSFLIDRNYSFSRSNNSFQTLVTFLDKSENSFTFEDAPFDPSIKTRTITADGK